MATSQPNLFSTFLVVSLLLLKPPLVAAQEVQKTDLVYPTIVEIDLVFPKQNTTYKRTSQMPIVFAFQNFTAVDNFSYFFQWHLRDARHKQRVFGTLDHGVFNTTLDSPVPEPFLVVNHTGDALLNREAAANWFLGYEFGYMSSCNVTEDGQLRGRVGPPITLLEGVVRFSVGDNGTEPDVAAAGPCAGALGNFDVLGHINVTADGYDCPVLPEDVSTTVTFGTLDKPEDGYQEEDIDPVNPCGVKVDADLAKQVSGILLKARCLETGNHTGECESAYASTASQESSFFAAIAAGVATALISGGVWFL